MTTWTCCLAAQLRTAAMAACLQRAGRLLRFEDAWRGARPGSGRLAQDLGQVAVDPVGFPADLDGDVAAFGDEAVIDGGLLEHGGAVSLQRAVRRTGAAYGPRSRRVGGGGQVRTAGGAASVVQSPSKSVAIRCA